MKVGFIGYGSMASTMVKSFLASGALVPNQIIVSSRRKDARDELLSSYPGIGATSSNRQAARESDILFMAVRSDEVKAVLDEITGDMRSDLHLVSINDGVGIRDLESAFGGKITKVMPPITMEVERGVILACHNLKVTDDDKARIHALFGRVGMIKEIDEDQFKIAGDLASSAPAFIASFIEMFAEAGARSGGIDRERAIEFAVETLHATSRMMEARGFDAATLVGKVATKGGITEQGVKVLEEEMPCVLDQMFRATGDRHDQAKAAIARQFGR